MPIQRSRIGTWLQSFRNLLGVGPHLLALGFLVEGLTWVLQRWVSFPLQLSWTVQVGATVLCVIGCMAGAVWFNSTLKLVEINFRHGQNELVTYGPFNYMRHPLYATLLLTLPPLFVIWFQDLIFLLAWVIIYLLTLRVVAVEERGLIETFGQDYERYRAYVPALLPYKGAAGRKYRADRDNSSSHQSSKVLHNFPYQISFADYWAGVDPNSMTESEIEQFDEEILIKANNDLLARLIQDAAAVPGCLGIYAISGGAYGYEIHEAVIQLEDGSFLARTWSDLPGLVSRPDARKVDLDLREELLQLRKDGTILRGAINENTDLKSGMSGRIATTYLAAGAEAEWFRFAMPLLSGEYRNITMNRLFVATKGLADQITLV